MAWEKCALNCPQGIGPSLVEAKKEEAPGNVKHEAANDRASNTDPAVWYVDQSECVCKQVGGTGPTVLVIRMTVPCAE